jgi:uncharacterized protein
MQLPEDPGPDFPFYKGDPIALTGGHWLVLLALVAVAFAILIAPISWPGGVLGAFVPALLFPAIPLAGLSFISKGNAGGLFGSVGWRAIKSMILFALLNLVVTMVVGGIVQATIGAAANQAIATANSLAPGELVLFLTKTAVQLVGEEVLTILPFLALLQWLVARGGMSRAAAVFWAWLASAVLFGSVHLPTYDWNFAQCLVIIGTARLVLTLAYIKTKNLWVSSGAHILNDWVLIVMNVVGTKLLHS